MEKTLIHQFDPVIYPFKIWVCITDNIQTVYDAFWDGKTNSEFQKVDASSFLAYTDFVRHKETMKYGAIIVFQRKKNMKPSIVAHESSHAAKFLFEYINADISHHEPFEYLLGWIVDCCFKVKGNNTPNPIHP